MEIMASRNKLVHIIFLSWVTAVASQVIRPDCPDMCGNVSIPYPFGTREDCSLNEYFFITCNHTSTPPKPFLMNGNIDVIDISLLDGELRIHTPVSSDCYNENGEFARGVDSNVSRFLPFPLSTTRNKFTTVGCDTYSEIDGSNSNTFSGSGCASMKNVTNGSCSGLGCSQTPIPQNLYKYDLIVGSYENHTSVWEFNPCSYAFIVEKKSFNFTSADLKDLQHRTEVPSVLDWAVGYGYQTCEEARKNSTSFACKAHSYCYDSDNGLGYRCNCLAGFRGNPYLPDGCKDIDECEENLHDCVKKEYCLNIEGNYTCSCPKGYHGDGRKGGEHCSTDQSIFVIPHGCQDIDECETSLHDCEKQEYCHNILGNYTCSCPMGYHGDGRKEGEHCTANQSIVIKVVAGIFISVFVLLFVGSWLYWGLKQRNLIKGREKFFKQNGGLMLKEKLSKYEGSVETVKIFTEEDLKKATNNFNENRVLGKGGQGTVYKGILPDNREVAIKKSTLANQSQVQQFINEVIVLSQVNHRNVVKLLGCCLETQVPLLVYEFVTNGTLFDYIHNAGHASSIQWKTRLRMAIETAKALSYLHSEASTPIIHRDVKTTNILLDDDYTAKVSDFGASKLVPIDKVQLTTLVQGTLGYLDPEYLLTSQLTEKSDVYSFGVVLVELLTGKMALSFERLEKEINLAMYFISSLKKDRLFEILDNQMVNEGNSEQIEKAAMLAGKCLRVKGEERPTMREVEIHLEGLRGMEMHSEIISEETEFLLTELSDNHACGSSSNTTGHDSMSNQVVAAFDVDGR